MYQAEPGGAIHVTRVSIEGQHHARYLAGLHGAEGLVDVLQAAAAGDHLVEHEAPLAVELEVAGDVGTEGVRAHAARLEAALRPQRHPGPNIARLSFGAI